MFDYLAYEARRLRPMSCLSSARRMRVPCALAGWLGLRTRVEPPPSARADTLAPQVATPRVATSTSLGRQVAFSLAVSAGPRPPRPLSSVDDFPNKVERLNPCHASYTAALGLPGRHTATIY